MSILHERVDGRGDSDDDREEDLEGGPERVGALGARVLALDDAHDGDGDEEEADGEEEEDAQALHGGDADGEDERAGDGHEENVGENVTNFVGEEPDVADDTGRLLVWLDGVVEDAYQSPGSG